MGEPTFKSSVKGLKHWIGEAETLMEQGSHEAALAAAQIATAYGQLAVRRDA